MQMLRLVGGCIGRRSRIPTSIIYAWNVNFSDGIVGYHSKNFDYRVCCIADF